MAKKNTLSKCMPWVLWPVMMQIVDLCNSSVCDGLWPGPRCMANLHPSVPNNGKRTNSWGNNTPKCLDAPLFAHWLALGWLWGRVWGHRGGLNA